MTKKTEKTLGNVFDFSDESDENIGAIKTKSKDNGLLDEFLDKKKEKKISTSIYVNEKYIKALDTRVDRLKRQARKIGEEDNLKISRNVLIEIIFEEYFFKNDK